MSGKCYEIGIIQAFLDGETSPELSSQISGHAATCDACASMIAEAEEQNSFVFAALDREYDTLVPTQRLWSKINDSIAVEKRSVTFWEKVRRSLAVLTINPSVAAVASVVIVFGIAAALWNFDNSVLNTTGPVARVSQPERTAEQVEVPIATTTSDAPVSAPAMVKATNLPPEKLKSLVENAGYRTPSIQPRAQHAVVRDVANAAPAAYYLPGEESYVRTISDLSKSVESQKDTVLSPSSRVSYERDMAVVNDSITKMKDVVRKDPKNQSARQVLYSSYQNKIDLLNSVVGREELLASLR